ncbi:hypothetical protein K5X82_07010 [Halosquirtibacter xylanolyticus]|uniref:hypothetical protein n=1 Tax=Halosquirtibacter xylanolyticus TaxID=3374599 RepID=UPI00374A5177|nr:hypothetical protein K5X82_07010 [Prolixibacteraceae bacterium]
MDKLISLLPSLILGAFGLIATISFSRSAKKREDDKMMKELFSEFNKRYDKLNNRLSQIVESNKGANSINDLAKIDKAVIIDFFNLCAEEYFWHDRNRIDEKIWLSWQAGMNNWYNHKNSIIRDLWKEEIKIEYGKVSYYIVNGDEFFKRNRRDGGAD